MTSPTFATRCLIRRYRLIADHSQHCAIKWRHEKMSEQKKSERKKAQKLKAKLTFPIYPELWAVDPTPVSGCEDDFRTMLFEGLFHMDFLL